MTKSCKYCGIQFEITQDDLVFYDKISPVFNGKKYQIPPPSLCSNCSAQKKLIWRNDKKFYKITIGNKAYISMYNENTDWKIIDSKDWWAQKYDIPFLNYDSNKSFFSQFGKLIKNTPHPHIITLNSENSDFTNFNGFCKNSYLCAAGNYSENIYYCYNAEKCVNCIDSLFIFDCENCSNLIHSSKCYNVHFSKHCENCSNSQFLDNCNGCSNCYQCSGLKNKSYNIFNIQYSKEEYEKKLEEIKVKGYNDLINQINNFYDFSKKIAKPLNHNSNSENCTGEYILDSKNCKDCYIMAAGCNDCKNVINGFPGLVDSYNCCYCGENSSLFYEAMGSGASCYKNIFSIVVLSNSLNTIYCDYCITCKDCFGCSGLHNKQYCILNKQYTKEEYETLVPKIIEYMVNPSAGSGYQVEWGEFFPSSISPFGYNETVAQEYFPLSKDEALKKGFNWSDYEAPFPKADKIISKEHMSKLPDNIKNIPDDILNWALTCEVSGRPYKIIKHELDFYRKHNIPIPRRHPDQRHLDRMKLRNPRRLYDRTCMKCNKSIQTTYAPDIPEIVYCEKCYNKEVY